MTFEFDMPGLSKYLFNTYGEVINKRTGQHIKMKPIVEGRRRYHVHDDDGKQVGINEAEIIQYGKHKQDEYKGGKVIMEMRIPSRANTGIYKPPSILARQIIFKECLVL